MDIRLLEIDDIPQAKALWKEAFSDSDAFIDWYFENKILPGSSLGLFDKGLACVVHMIPHRVRVQGRALESAFIAGAATSVKRRGEGLMRTMLLESLRLMKQRGIVMTHLYPFKHSFYENFGWATYSYVQNKTAKEACYDPEAEVVGTADLKLLAPLYDTFMRALDGYIIRSEREWRWRLEELWADGGKAVLLKNDGKPSAYMLYYNGEEKAEVIETVYSREQDIYPLLECILKQNKSVQYFIPAPGNADAAPYGMARVVDAQALLELFGAQELLEHMRINDSFAPWNNIGEGKEITIEELAKTAHQGAGVLGSGKANEPGHSMLSRVFLYRGTCIFEQY